MVLRGLAPDCTGGSMFDIRDDDRRVRFQVRGVLSGTRVLFYIAVFLDTNKILVLLFKKKFLFY